MSADSFHVCCGLRCEVDAADTETVELLEERRHPWQLAARQHRLQTWWGTTTDDDRVCILIGRVIGHYGWEGEASGQLTDQEATRIMAETAERLRTAGIEGLPAWHFQFVPDR
jgi:hypothetical protein